MIAGKLDAGRRRPLPASCLAKQVAVCQFLATVRSLLRLLAFFTLLVFSGQAVLSALHHAVLVHEVCADHGELVHAGHAEAHGNAAREATEARSESVDQREYRAASDDEHAHDHCNACAAFRLHIVALLGLDATFVESKVAARVAAAQISDVCTPDGLGLHRLAPKQGPPRVG